MQDLTPQIAYKRCPVESNQSVIRYLPLILYIMKVFVKTNLHVIGD